MGYEGMAGCVRRFPEGMDFQYGPDRALFDGVGKGDCAQNYNTPEDAVRAAYGEDAEMAFPCGADAPVWHTFSLCASKFGVETPRVCVVRSDCADATVMTCAACEFVLLTTGIIDLLRGGEMRYMAGHLIGHMLYGHPGKQARIDAAASGTGFSVYESFRETDMVFSAERIPDMALGEAHSAYEWTRAADVTADRAGVIFAGGAKHCINALARISGWTGDYATTRRMYALIRLYRAMDAREAEDKLKRMLTGHEDTFRRMLAAEEFAASRVFYAWNRQAYDRSAVRPMQETEKRCRMYMTTAFSAMEENERSNKPAVSDAPVPPAKTREPREAIWAEESMLVAEKTGLPGIACYAGGEAVSTAKNETGQIAVTVPERVWAALNDSPGAARFLIAREARKRENIADGDELLKDIEADADAYDLFPDRMSALFAIDMSCGAPSGILPYSLVRTLNRLRAFAKEEDDEAFARRLRPYPVKFRRMLALCEFAAREDTDARARIRRYLL